jgi:dCTP deaminase
MILERDDIKYELAQGNIVIQPFTAANLGTNSYDFTLGNDFFLVHYHGLNPYFYGPVHVPDGEPLLLPQGETILGMTQEVIGAVRNIVGKTYARSSTGRVGTTICRDAGLGDVGYIDHWTLELGANTRPYSVVWPGERIGQMVFTASGISRPVGFKRPPGEELRYTGQYLREWPANMVPKQFQEHRIALEQDYYPAIFVDLAAGFGEPSATQEIEVVTGSVL